MAVFLFSIVDSKYVHVKEKAAVSRSSVFPPFNWSDIWGTAFTNPRCILLHGTAFLVCFLDNIIYGSAWLFCEFLDPLALSSCSIHILLCLGGRLILYILFKNYFSLLFSCLPFFCACLDFDCMLLQDKWEVCLILFKESNMKYLGQCFMHLVKLNAKMLFVFVFIFYDKYLLGFW